MLTKRKTFCSTPVGLEHHEAPEGAGPQKQGQLLALWLVQGEQHLSRPRKEESRNPSCSRTLPEPTSKARLALFRVFYITEQLD